MRRCHALTSDTYLRIVRAEIGLPDGLHVASQMTKSISSCSASSLAACGDDAVSCVRGLTDLPKWQYLSHHLTPGRFAPAALSDDAAAKSCARCALRHCAVLAAADRSADTSGPERGMGREVSRHYGILSIPA